MSILLFFFGLLAFSTAATVTYDWNITWVNAAPDGFSRPVIGINGQWPCPSIEANLNDQVVINLNNQLVNESTSLHFHGISQSGSPQMDGPSAVSQCPVPPGSSFTYTFTVDTPGTYWYHSHNMGQYPDGLRGPLIVYDPNNPYAGAWDEEIVLSVTDWYHDQAPTLIQNMLVTSNTDHVPPIPVAGLLNESSTATLNFSPGKSYLVRVISFAAFASVFMEFDSHTMTIVELDGVYSQMYNASQIRVAPAQRYSFILTAKNSDAQHYAFIAALDINADYTAGGATYPFNATGLVSYNSGNPSPTPLSVASWDPVNDIDMTPYDNEAILPDADQTLVMNFTFGLDNIGIPRAFINNVTYVSQNVPSLYTALTTGSSATNPIIYGQVNPFVISSGQIIDIVLNNFDSAIHPFHLHGHDIQLLAEAPSNSGPFAGDTTGFPQIPMRRDTLTAFANSHIVVRFKADNPGVWLFHCHIEWHVEMGLTATIIESPTELQGFISIDEMAKDNCEIMGMGIEGNAAGNTVNLTDLTGANTQTPNPDPGAVYTGSNADTSAVKARFLRL